MSINKILMLLLLSTSCFVYGQNKTDFELCGDSLTYPYYFPALKYEGDFYAIKSHFRMNYPLKKMEKLSNNTGIICVQFHVNCYGETGDFKVLQYSLDYKTTILNPKLVAYFYKKTTILDNWIPAKNDEGTTVNSHKFFSFRIVNGALIEILPK